MASAETPDADLELALDNWGRWCREMEDARLGADCRSIEHRYRSPQQWYALPPPRIPRGPIDRRSALDVNRAWRAIPQPYKGVLSDWYVRHASPQSTCRRLAIRFSLHQTYLDRARSMIRNQLTRLNPTGTRRPQVPPTADTAI